MEYFFDYVVRPLIKNCSKNTTRSHPFNYLNRKINKSLTLLRKEKTKNTKFFILCKLVDVILIK